MGCGGSKIDQNDDEVPARFKPILQNRLDEIQAKRTSKTSDGLSKKDQLLGEDTESDNEEVTSTNSDPTFHVTQDCPPTLQKISVDTSFKLSQEQDLRNNITVCENVEEDRNPRKRQISQGSLEDESDFDDNDSSGLGRGSPSFKVYCAESHYEDDDEHIDEEVTVEGQRNSISQESCCSNDVSVKHIPSKKGKHGRKFKLMMPNGGKLLNNMHSFYNFSCSSQSNTHLLQKAPS